MFWVYQGLGFRKVTIYATFILFYFYVRYCGNLRCVGFLCNSQACLATSSAVLGMLCNVLGMLCKVLGRPQHALCFATPLACFTRSLAHLGMLLQGPMEAWWYTTPLASQLIRQQMGGGGVSSMWDSQDLEKTCQGRPRTLQSMPRALQSMPRSAEDVAKHAQELQNKPTYLRFPQAQILSAIYIYIYIYYLFILIGTRCLGLCLD